MNGANARASAWACCCTPPALPEHAARLAAVLTVAADPDAGEIQADAMDCGADLARHYAAEALRLMQGSANDPELRLAKQTLAWMKSRGEPLFHMRELYRLGPAAIREKTTATKIVGILVDHGCLEQVPGGAELDGAWRKDVYRLVTDE